MTIDTFGQFAKLCPSYSRSIDMPKEDQLYLVECHLGGERLLSDKGHWAYDLNRHIALIELRDALKAELGCDEFCEVAA
jgi:hypothetical protein